MKPLICQAHYSEESQTLTINLEIPEVLRRRLRVACDIEGLSTRERQVLDLTLEGKGQKEIASDLNVSLRTVKYHAENIWRKMKTDRSSALSGLLTEKEQHENTSSSHRTNGQRVLPRIRTDANSSRNGQKRRAVLGSK